MKEQIHFFFFFNKILPIGSNSRNTRNRVVERLAGVDDDSEHPLDKLDIAVDKRNPISDSHSTGALNGQKQKPRLHTPKWNQSAPVAVV